jgi:PAS domain S-box-containing protein
MESREPFSKRSPDAPEPASGKPIETPQPGAHEPADVAHGNPTRPQLEEALIGTREELEVAHCDREERYRALFERSRDLVYLHDFAGHFLDANPAALAALGYRQDEIRALNFSDLLDPADLPKAAAALEELGRTGAQNDITEFRVRCKDGEWLCFETKASVIYAHGQPYAVQGIARDITGRKRDEQALRQTQERLELAQRVGRFGHYTWDVQANTGEWSAEYEALYGLAPGTFGGTIEAWRALVHPEDLERAERATGAMDGDGPYCSDFRVIWPDGSIHWLHARSRMIRAQDGTPLRLVGVNLDVTERKHIEERLADLAAAVEQVADDIVVTDIEGRVRYVNPAFECTTGYSLAESTGRDITTLLGGDPDAAAEREMWDAVRAGGVWQGRFENRTRDGRLILQDATISPIRDASGRITGYASVRRDVTRKVELEAHAAQAQRLEAIGTLAGGIAHDLNNTLGAVIGYTEMALDKCAADPALPGGGELRDDLQAIMQGSRRASDLIRQILAFSRQEKREVGPVQVGPIVHDALAFLRAAIPAAIEIDEHIDSSSSVLADPSEIHQVMVNLCTNASAAMSERGGTLEVRLADEELDAGHSAQRLGLAPGRFLRLTVSDDGCGMTPEVLARVFEPFFTTRANGLGTGLGLAIVHGIVKRAGGAINVASEVGKGTTLEIYLPVAAARTAETGPTPDRPGAGTERILFVDDEVMLGRLAVQALGRSGYQVTTFATGMEALAAFEADPGGVDLVVTDMTMPGMTGDELTRRLRRIRPDLPIVLCTGFSERIDAKAAKAMGIDEFVMKPVLMSELAKVIRGALDRVGPAGA